MKKVFYLLLVLGLPLAASAQGKVELGYQTTRRGIVWYRSAPPTHAPIWRLSQDTNAVQWVDRTTGLEYDWDYSATVWRTYGTYTTSLPPLATFTSGLATIDNRAATWRNDDKISHYFDRVHTAWVPMGNFLVLGEPPANVAAGGGNGAAIYTTSLWQDSDDFTVYYWDGSAWVSMFGATGPAGGDLNGTYPDPEVVGIQGVPVSPTPPLSGQIFQYSGTQWAPSWGSPYTYVTATATITTAVNKVLIGTLPAPATFGLPACSAVNDGKEFQFQFRGGSAHGATIDANSTQTFSDGSLIKIIYSGGIGLLCTCRWDGSAGVWYFNN